jgi:hypothetical protein
MVKIPAFLAELVLRHVHVQCDEAHCCKEDVGGAAKLNNTMNCVRQFVLQGSQPLE